MCIVLYFRYYWELFGKVVPGSEIVVEEEKFQLDSDFVVNG